MPLTSDLAVYIYTHRGGQLKSWPVSAYLNKSIAINV